MVENRHNRSQKKSTQKCEREREKEREKDKEISTFFLQAGTETIFLTPSVQTVKKRADDLKYAQNISRDNITVSYRAIRVRCCLQEEWQRKKVSVKLPCLLKKPQQQEWHQNKSPSHLFSVCHPYSPRLFQLCHLQVYGLLSSQLLLQASTCDTGEINYFSQLVTTTGKFLPCSNHQSLGPGRDCHQQAGEKVDDTETPLDFRVSYKHIGHCTCSQEHESSYETAGQDPKHAMESKRRTVNSGTLFLNGICSTLQLRESKMLELVFCICRAARSQPKDIFSHQSGIC